MLYRMDRAQTLPIPQDEAWRFFSTPGNLPRITPPWLDFTVLSDAKAEMYAGMILRFRLRPLLRFPVSWTTEITHMQKPSFFVDEQRFGPYRFWHHQHRFSPVKDGTRVEDVVHYRLKGGILGRALFAKWIYPRVVEIFEYRRKVLLDLFPGLAETRPDRRPGGPEGSPRRNEK